MYSFIDLDKYSRKIYSSQGGQDGILKHIFDTIGRTNRSYVEFGFNVPDYYPDCGANTGYFRICEGWNGVCFDIHNENHSIGLWRERITSENVVETFKKYNVPNDVDYVSIDIDSTDLWVFKSIISSGIYKPRVITVEFNSRFDIGESYSVIDAPDIEWTDSDWVYGASLSALYDVGRKYGYTLVACESTLDAFFIRSELVEKAPTIDNFRRYCNVHWANEPTSERKLLMQNFYI